MATIKRFQDVRSIAGHRPNVGRATAEELKLTTDTHFQEVRSMAGHRPSMPQHGPSTG